MSGGGGGDDEHDCECPHVEEEPWLVSYADLMTLLFGFFVIMYAFAVAKLERSPSSSQDIIPMRKEIASYFGGQYVVPLKDVTQKFKEAVGGLDIAKKTKVLINPEGLDITFHSNVIFKTGKAEIHDETAKALKVLAKLVLNEKEDYRVVVEGHTDDAPIKTFRYPSNWELSGARASSVIRLFEREGFDSQSLLGVGYGSSRPQFPNRDSSGNRIEENMARNRRIRIKISLLGDGFKPKSFSETDDILPPVEDLKENP